MCCCCHQIGTTSTISAVASTVSDSVTSCRSVLQVLSRPPPGVQSSNKELEAVITDFSAHNNPQVGHTLPIGNLTSGPAGGVRASSAVVPARAIIAGVLQDRLKLLLEHAKQLPPIPVAAKTDSNRVMGCTAQVSGRNCS